MRVLCFVVALILSGATVARSTSAEEPSAQTAVISVEDRAAIQAVITAQMDAFKRDDGPAAFAFASPSIQAMFGDAENFMRMVRTGYPTVYRPKTVSFGEITQTNGHWIQKVVIDSVDGTSDLAVYTMMRGNGGQWQIDGCALARSEAVGA